MIDFLMYLFPISGILGILYHYIMAMELTRKAPLENLPNHYKVTLIINYIVTFGSGLILLITGLCNTYF